MNYIKHLNAFFDFIKRDDRLSTSHVSLYMALFQYWNFNRFQNPFPIYRDNIMRLSKIGSKNTYHKCLKELHQARYIYYHPAPSKYQPVKISMSRLYEDDEVSHKQLKLFNESIPSQQENTKKISIENDTVQVPDLKNTGLNNDTVQISNMRQSLKHINHKQQKEETHEKNFEKKEHELEQSNNVVHVSNLRHMPSLPEVEIFFQESNYPITEAQKYFHHYQSNGWLVANKTPMKDWKSSAHKWMLNAKAFNKNENNNHSLNNDKNYSEPL